MAATLAAAKLGIPVAHVEAGLRSFDRTMPEEINRIVTDSISDMLLVSEPEGLENLQREGHENGHVHLVGNVMIDTLLHQLPAARQLNVLERLGLPAGGYGVVTLHRPSNVDQPETLGPLIDVLIDISDEPQARVPRPSAHDSAVRSVRAVGADSRRRPGSSCSRPWGTSSFYRSRHKRK